MSQGIGIQERNETDSIFRAGNRRPPGIVCLMGLLFILISFFETTAQEAQITYSASEKPLDKVLEELSQRYRFRFAYDAARFSQFKVSFTVRNSTWGELTDILKHKYPLRFKYLEGTWIVTLHPEAKKPPESKPSVAQKKLLRVCYRSSDRRATCLLQCGFS